MKPVRKCVFPVNGLGTRFLPATKAIPKEMLPIVDKPLIQYAVEEAAAAGITEIIFVTGRYKREIEDHFDCMPSLEAELQERGKTELLKAVRETMPAGVNFICVRQPKALGLGHAVLCARPVVGDEPFAVILPDDLVDAEVPVTKQLMDAREACGGGSVLAVQNVPRELTNQYGIVSCEGDASQKTVRMTGIVEKPSSEEAPSTLAVIGRYVLESTIFDYLAKQERGKGGEIQLTDAIEAALGETKTYAHNFDGKRFDCGSKQGFVDATVAYARKFGFAIN